MNHQPRTRTRTGIGALVAFAVTAVGVAPLGGDAPVGAAPPSGDATWAFTRLSVAPDGTIPNGPSFSPALSGDGQHVAFITSATNLTDTPFESPGAVVIRDLLGGWTELIDVATPGSPPVDPTAVDVNRDGTVIATASSSDHGPVVVTDRVAGTSVVA